MKWKNGVCWQAITVSHGAGERLKARTTQTGRILKSGRTSKIPWHSMQFFVITY